MRLNHAHANRNRVDWKLLGRGGVVLWGSHGRNDWWAALSLIVFESAGGETAPTELASVGGSLLD